MSISELHDQPEKSPSSGIKVQHNFDWSLKPLIGLMKFLSGVNLHISKDSTSNSVMKNVLFTSWAAFIIVSNIFINGSYIESHHAWAVLPTITNAASDSPWATFFWNPQALFEFTCYYSSVFFFLFVPAIHLIFFVTVLFSSRWKDLLGTFQDIYRRVKLAEYFYRRCRRLCCFLILLLVLVNEIWPIFSLMRVLSSVISFPPN